MSVLKKLGQLLFKGLLLAEGIQPLITPLLGSGRAARIEGTVVNDFTSIGTVVVQIETALQGKPGADKLEAAIPLVRSIVMTSEMVIGKKVADDAKLTKGIEELTQAVYDILDSLHGDAVKTA